jgi:uncharacterized membrane protein YqjE
LAIATLRARAVPSTLASLFLLSRVVVIAALIVGSLAGEYQQAAIAFGDVLLLLGLGGIGWHLLRSSAA